MDSSYLDSLINDFEHMVRAATSDYTVRDGITCRQCATAIGLRFSRKQRKFKKVLAAAFDIQRSVSAMPRGYVSMIYERKFTSTRTTREARCGSGPKS